MSFVRQVNLNDEPLLGLAVVPDPAAKAPTGATALCTQLQNTYLPGANAVRAVQISNNMVQSKIKTHRLRQLCDELDNNNLTLRATYVAAAPDASPVCAQFTGNHLRYALDNSNGIKVPHPLGYGEFDFSASASKLQYSTTTST